MRKVLKSYLVAVATCVFAGILASCGADSIAGGAGAGNPGKTTIAIVAREKGAAPCVSGAVLTKPGVADALVVTDSSNNVFTVENSFVIVKRIHFVVEPKNKEQITNAAVCSPLRKDAESIILDGTFTFNAMNGTCEPPVGALTLPDADYKGVKLVIENGPEKNSISLSGTFIYFDTIRRFNFDLPLTVNVTYENDGEAVHISGADSTDIRIVLDASMWLSNISTDACIVSQGAAFDTTGIFVLDGKVPAGACAEIPKKISENIIQSGKLKIKQIKVP